MHLISPRERQGSAHHCAQPRLTDNTKGDKLVRIFQYILRLDYQAGHVPHDNLTHRSLQGKRISLSPPGNIHPRRVSDIQSVLPWFFQVHDKTVKRDQFSGLGGELLVHLIDIQGRADHPADFGNDGHLFGKPLGGFLVPAQLLTLDYSGHSCSYRFKKFLLPSPTTVSIFQIEIDHSDSISG
jgi:hypothetical protein